MEKQTILQEIFICFWKIYDLLAKLTNKQLAFQETENKIHKWNYTRYILKKYSKSNDKEIKEVVDYIRKNGLGVFNYPFIEKYNDYKIIVQYDSDNIPYVMYYDKKMFFPPKWEELRIIDYVTRIYLEQDENSPHVYVNEHFQVYNNGVLLDCGAAEANFSLLNIEKLKKVIIFECEQDWIEAIGRTFAPWKEKVIIIPKYLSNINNTQCITLDKVFKQYRELIHEDIFIKMDIEGYEEQALEGMKVCLTKIKKCRLSICAYHKDSSERHIKNFMKNNNFSKIDNSKGFLVFYFSRCSTNILRRGIIYGEKIQA